MGITIATTVTCDVKGENCRYWVSTGDEGNIIKAQAERANAKQEGWIRRWNKKIQFFQDVCPNCIAEVTEK